MLPGPHVDNGPRADNSRYGLQPLFSQGSRLLGFGRLCRGCMRLGEVGRFVGTGTPRKWLGTCLIAPTSLESAEGVAILLKAAVRRCLAAGQGELDLGLEVTEPARRGAGGGPLPISWTRMGHLLDSLERA
jgi:hypothetical protein